MRPAIELRPASPHAAPSHHHIVLLTNSLRSRSVAKSSLRLPPALSTSEVIVMLRASRSNGNTVLAEHNDDLLGQFCSGCGSIRPGSQGQGLAVFVLAFANSCHLTTSSAGPLRRCEGPSTLQRFKRPWTRSTPSRSTNAPCLLRRTLRVTAQHHNCTAPASLLLLFSRPQITFEGPQLPRILNG